MIRNLLEKIKTFWKAYIIKDRWFLAREQFKKDNAEQGLRYEYPLNSEGIVVDLGGYKGEWAQVIWGKYKCNIFIFEPVKELFDEAVEKFKGNPKVHLYNYGLSDKDSKDLISMDGLASSQFTGNRTIEVEFKDIKKVFEELNLQKVDLIKINIEGGEFKVLPRMIESRLVDKCTDMQIQFHHFYPNSEKLREEIRAGLLKTHQPTYDYPFFFENYRKSAGWRMKRICFFGIYDREYARNKVIIDGFIENGVEVVHCNVNPRHNKGIKKYWLLVNEWRKIKNQNFDFIFIGFPGHTCVWLAKLLFLNKKIVFDIFISQYASVVVDRKRHKPHSFNGYKNYFLDWYSIRVADVVVIDTFEHIKAFERNYGLRKEKALRIFLSSPLTPVDTPRSSRGREKFIVHYHGTYIGLHGVEYIVRAAKLVEHKARIVFRMIGSGQLLEEMKSLAQSLGLKNIEFLGRIPEYKDVLERIQDADVLLGAFGTTPRAHWVIMNKIFEGMVFGKAILSSNTPAMRELFTDRKDILFCQDGNAEDLANKILELENNETLKEKIGLGALNLFKRRLLPKMLVKDFLTDLKKII